MLVDPNNKIQYQAYQTNYLQQIKQVNDELEILYDFLEETDVLELYKINEKVRPSVLEKIFNFDLLSPYIT